MGLEAGGNFFLVASLRDRMRSHPMSMEARGGEVEV